MNILIISPGFVPMAGVGKMRMASLVKYMKDNHTITVIQNKISSYDEITDEEPIENIKIVEADVKGRFKDDFKAYKVAMKQELDSCSYDIVLITVGPYFTLPLAKVVKQRYDIPVIVDYRDLWTNSYRSLESVNVLKSAVKIYGIEKPSLKYIDGLSSCDERSVGVLKKQYRFLRDVPSQHIYNGYDDAELQDIIIDREREYKKGQTTIGIYGKFDYYIGYDNVHWFIEELEKLIELKQEKIKIVHYGKREEYFASVLETSTIEYEWRGFVEYKVGMNALAKEADILVAANDVLLGYGTKVFDYIYLNKPIVMFAFEGSDLKSFVSSFENGYAFTTPEELTDILEEIVYKRPNNLAYGLDAEKYGRSRQNKRFEEFIVDIVSKRK